MARHSMLSPRQLYALDLACHPIHKAFVKHGGPMTGLYLVGSAVTGADSAGTRDVDVRLMIQDDHYDRMMDAVGIYAIRLMGLAIGEMLAKQTGLPIDFQIQRTSEANEKHGPRKMVHHTHEEPILGCRCAEFPGNVRSVGGERNPLGRRTLDNFLGDGEPDEVVVRPHAED